MSTPSRLISLRPATAADLPFLLALRRSAMTPHLQAAWIAQDEAGMMERVLVGFEGARIIEFAGGAIGLLKMIKGERAWDIVQIQLLPEWQGQGIGALLLSQALAEAAEAKATVLLSVLKVNKARRLYERLGFSVISEDENSYSMRATP